MQNKTIYSFNKRFIDFAIRTKSWHPVERNGWFIKFSIFKGQSILLTIVSRYTAQTIIRYFNNEDEAVDFINFIIEMSAEDEL